MHASRDICLVLLCQTGRWLLDDSLPKSSYNLADRCAKLSSPLEDFRCRTSPPSPKSPRTVGFSAARSCQHAELLCVNPRASWIWMVFGALRASEQSHQSHQGFWKRVGTCRDSIFVWWKRWVSIRKQWSLVVIAESWHPDISWCFGMIWHSWGRNWHKTM